MFKGSPKFTRLNRFEELRSKLNRPQFPVPAMSKGSVLDQREIKILVARASKRIAAQSAETPMIRPAPPGTLIAIWKKSGYSLLAQSNPRARSGTLKSAIARPDPADPFRPRPRRSAESRNTH